MRIWGWIIALLGLVFSGCTPCGFFEGELEGPCYANNTCNAGLVCLAGYCAVGGDVLDGDGTTPPDSSVGIDEGTVDVTPPSDTAPPEDLNIPLDSVPDDSDASTPGDVLVNHCEGETHTCDLNATCTPSALEPKGYICTCNLGFSGNGEECSDVDECAAGNDSCGESQTCVNTEGSFVCSDLEVEISAVDYSEVNPSITGMVPYTVHVDGLNSLIGGGTVLTARHLWSFGDATEETKYNVIEGWGGAHIYHAPGTYSITLEITNEVGATESVNTTVNVIPDSRQAIYISAIGSDANDGLTEGTPIRSTTRIQELMGNNRAFLFNRGETHDFSAIQLTIEGVENVVLGAYGVGAKPIIMGPAYDAGSQQTLISVVSHSTGTPTRNLTIRDLQFRTPSPASATEEFNHIAIQLQGRDIINTTIRDNHFVDVGSCVLVDKGGWDEAVEGNVRPSGLLLQDNTVDTVSRYFTFFRSNNTTMMGNSSTNGSLTSFIFRYYADKVFIYFNDWKQPVSPLEEFAIAGGSHCGQFGNNASDCEPEHENAFWGQYTYAAQNNFDGTLRLGYENSDTVFSYYRYIVLERNRFTRLAPNQSPTPTIRHWKYTDKIMVRNNLFLGPFGFVSMTGEGATDVRFYNNTGLDPANAHSFVNVYGANPALDSFHFANNLWISPSYVPNQFGGYPYVLAFPSLDLTGYSFKNNLWPTKSDPGVPGGEIYGGQDYSSEAWKLLPQTSNERFHTMEITDVDSQYRPLLGTLPYGAGIAVPGVITDYYGNLRPASGAWTVGAVEAQ